MTDLTVDISRFISRIYDGVVAPDVWGDVLDEMTQFVDARGVNLAIIDTVHSHLQISMSNRLFSPEDLQYYNEHLAQYEASAWEILNQHKAGRAFSDLELKVGVLEHLSDTPVADWVLNTIGCRYRAGIRLTDGKPWYDVLTLQFSRERDPIRPEERKILELFAPHFSKAIELNRPFAMLKARYSAVMAFLDKLNLGVAIVTPNAEVVLANEECTRIFEDLDGLSMQRNTRMQLSKSETNDKFLSAVREFSGGSAGSIVKKPLSALFSVDRPSGKLPYIVEICPVGVGADTIDANFYGAVAVVLDPENRQAINPKGLDQLFGLTGAEFQITKLILEGDSTRKIAEKRNVTPETVRSQAKSVLQKTGCQTRNDLLRLAVAANPPIKD